MKIVHVTSAHSRKDVRIFQKMAVSAAANDHDVTVICSDGGCNERVSDVNIISIDKAKTRIFRWFYTPWKIYFVARKLNADIFHLHDPELLQVALFLKSKKSSVIFDSHEDFVKHLQGKKIRLPFLVKVIATIFGLFQRVICARLDGIITATPAIKDTFQKFNSDTVTVHNYPKLDEWVSTKKWSEKDNEICFVGGISEIRGIKPLCDATMLTSTNVKLRLAGSFSNLDLRKDLENSESWQNIIYEGQLPREQVSEVLSKAKVGIVTFLPVPNHIEAQPNKLFEYMSASLPVIASDFPLWRSIVSKYNCGILVEPNEPSAVAKAIDFLLSNEKEAEEMGRRGRNAVLEEFNWDRQRDALLEFYNLIYKN